MRGQCILRVVPVYVPAFAGTHCVYPRRDGQAELIRVREKEKEKKKSPTVDVDVDDVAGLTECVGQRDAVSARIVRRHAVDDETRHFVTVYHFHLHTARQLSPSSSSSSYCYYCINDISSNNNSITQENAAKSRRKLK